MISVTPARASIREPSTRPSLPTSPMAVRCPPGIGRALYPMSSMVFTTRSISCCVAPCRITTSMSSVLELDPVPVVRYDERPCKRHPDQVRDVHGLHRRVQVRENQLSRFRETRHLAALLRGQMLDDRHRCRQRTLEYQEVAAAQIGRASCRERV